MSAKVLCNVGTPQFCSTDAKLNDYNLVATTEESYCRVEELEGNCVYYFMVTATNAHGEGYKCKTPTFART